MRPSCPEVAVLIGEVSLEIPSVSPLLPTSAFSLVFFSIMLQMVFDRQKKLRFYLQQEEIKSTGTRSGEVRKASMNRAVALLASTILTQKAPISQPILVTQSRLLCQLEKHEEAVIIHHCFCRILQSSHNRHLNLFAHFLRL